MLLEAVVQLILKHTEFGVNVDGQFMNNLRFADDIDLIIETAKELKSLQIKLITTVKYLNS
jgi:hypothetical protein